MFRYVDNISNEDSSEADTARGVEIREELRAIATHADPEMKSLIEAFLSEDFQAAGAELYERCM